MCSSDLLEFELPRPDVRRHDLVFDLLLWREVLDGNAVEASAEACEGADMTVDRRTPEVLDQVVVDMDPIHRGAGGVHFVEVRQVVIYEVR